MHPLDDLEEGLCSVLMSLLMSLIIDSLGRTVELARSLVVNIESLIIFWTIILGCFSDFEMLLFSGQLDFLTSLL